MRWSSMPGATTLFATQTLFPKQDSCCNSFCELFPIDEFWCGVMDTAMSIFFVACGNYVHGNLLYRVTAA